MRRGSLPPSPHTLGIDDGPFRRGPVPAAPLVAVLMEGAGLVEGVAVTRFPLDGADATSHLARWIRGLRFHPSVQAVLLGGITLGGLGVVDVRALARRVGCPVIVVNRKNPAESRLEAALRAAGHAAGLEILRRTPPARTVEPGLFVAAAGLDPFEAERLVRAVRQKSALPEPIRIAHLIAAAIRHGESRGRA